MNSNDFDLKSYDLIAIDMDNTLVKYQLRNLLPLIHRLINKYLIERYDYPKEICEEFCPKLSQKGLIIDKIRGNILKLDSNYGIMSAKHGFNDLSKEQIDTIYGNLRQQIQQIPEDLSHVEYTTIESEFYVLKDYFSTPVAQVMAKVVEVFDKLTIDSNYEKIWKNIYEVLCYIYDKNAFKSRTAGFFPELISNPDKYLEKSSENLKQVLKSLRKIGKLVFLVTSSNIDYTRFLMNFSYGNDWIHCFDCVLTFARKPLFFTKNQRFLSMDSNDNIESTITFDDLKCGHFYLEGNWNDLKCFVSKQINKTDPKCVFIGDSFNDDCIVPNKYVDCDTIAVVEELEELDRQELEPTYWQSFFTDASNNTTLWYHLLKIHSKLIIPNLENLNNYFKQI